MVNPGRVSVVVYPDDPVAARADAVRRKFDPHADLVGPHITIAFPDVPRRDADLSHVLRSAASSVEPLEIELGPAVGPASFVGPDRAAMDFLVARYPNARGWVVSVVGDGAAPLLEVRRLLDAAIPQPPELLGFAPYLTLGQSLEDPAAALAAAAVFGPVRFRADALVLLAEGPTGAWSEPQRVSLGR